MGIRQREKILDSKKQIQNIAWTKLKHRNGFSKRKSIMEGFSKRK
jgi:hypothetical protein